MAIPDFQECMRPLLDALSDGAEKSFNEAYEAVCSHFHLTDDEKREMLPSGKQTVVRNRCGWSSTYLAKAGFLTRPRQSYMQITEEGLQALQERPDGIDVSYLKSKSPKFVVFHTAKPKSSGSKSAA